MPSEALQKAEWEATTALVLSGISFYAATTSASEAARLHVRRMLEGGYKLIALDMNQCDRLAAELNNAIKPVLDRWVNRSIENAKNILQTIPSGSESPPERL